MLKSKFLSGTVSLRKPDTSLSLQRLDTATVSTQGKETFHLHFRTKPLREAAKFQLCDLKGNVIQTWPFHFSFWKTTLDLDNRSGQMLRYEIRLFGRIYFVTSTGEKRTFMEVKENTRSFTLDGMKFQHQDFQTEMSFICPEDRLHQAILIANLLFNTPVFSNE